MVFLPTYTDSSNLNPPISTTQGRTQPLTPTPLLSHTGGPHVPILQPWHPSSPARGAPGQSSPLTCTKPYSPGLNPEAEQPHEPLVILGQYSRKAGPPATYPTVPPAPLAPASGCSNTCDSINQHSLSPVKMECNCMAKFIPGMNRHSFSEFNTGYTC